jgi:hypothetical protein
MRLLGVIGDERAPALRPQFVGEVYEIDGCDVELGR